jgi:hypothetical protein
MIPNDVWMIVFRLLGHKDISTVFPLRQVCKRWEGFFPNSLTDATVSRDESLNGLLSLPCLRSLNVNVEVTKEVFEKCMTKLESLVLTNNHGYSAIEKPYRGGVSNSIWSQMTNLKSLDISDLPIPSSSSAGMHFICDPPINDKNLVLLTNLQTLRIGRQQGFLTCDSLIKLVHLKELDIYHVDDEPLLRLDQFRKRYGENLIILDYLPELEVIKIPFFYSPFFNYIETKRKYPHVRFLLYLSKYIIYEGELSPINHKLNGKGVLSVSIPGLRPLRYEGIFKDQFIEGEGICYYDDTGDRYEGGFKKGLREGKGIIYYLNGDRLEVDFLDDEGVGKGIMYSKEGGQFEVNIKDGKVEGEAIFF